METAVLFDLGVGYFSHQVRKIIWMGSKEVVLSTS